MGGDGCYDDQLLKLAGNAAEGMILSTMAWGELGNPAAKVYFQKYRAKYHREPAPFSGLAYDAVQVVAMAIKQGGYNAAGIKNALYSLQYPGVTGLNKFDQFGEVDKEFDLYVVKGGKFELFEKGLK